mgnify:CR=1 FL=1
MTETPVVPGFVARNDDAETTAHRLAEHGIEQIAGADSPGGTAYAYWVPVAACIAGPDGSEWQTTVGALNRSPSPATLGRLSEPAWPFWRAYFFSSVRFPFRG